MSDLALDASGDILIDKNSFVMIDGAAAVTQELGIRFNFFLGEWFLNIDVGVPWFRDILVKTTSFAVVQQVLKDTILETPGILELLDFNFVFDSSKREANLKFKALASTGVIDFSQIIEVG